MIKIFRISNFDSQNWSSRSDLIKGRGYRALAGIPDPDAHPGPHGEVIPWHFYESVEKIGIGKRIETIICRIHPIPRLLQMLDYGGQEHTLEAYKELYNYCENVIRPYLAEQQEKADRDEVIKVIKNSRIYQDSTAQISDRIRKAWGGTYEGVTPELEDARILFADYADKYLIAPFASL